MTGWTREQVNFCNGRIVDQAVVGGRVTSVGAGDCGEDSGAVPAGGLWASSLPNATRGIGRQAAAAEASDASRISSTLPIMPESSVNLLNSLIIRQGPMPLYF